MDDASSVACPVVVGTLEQEKSRSLLRWIVLGAASLILFVLAMAHSAAVGAASPYPPNTVISTYVDPRYCNGVVSVATDASSNLIDICTATGQRIYPVYSDYGYPAGYIAGNYATPYFNGNFANANYFNGNFAYANYFNGNFANGNFFNGNFCNVNVNCATFPAGGTVVGGVVYYNDNRFCTDGKIAFVPGQGYFCQNGGPLVPNGATTVNCGNFFVNGCGTYRFFEASSTTVSAAPSQTTQVTTTTAAPKAPVVAPAAPVAAPAAPASAKVTTTFNAPAAKAPSAALAPAAQSGTGGADDHRG